jgi:predicted Zn-dependent peptidase
MPPRTADRPRAPTMPVRLQTFSAAPSIDAIAFRLPDVQETQLENGVRIVSYVRHGLPTFSMTIGVARGPRDRELGESAYVMWDVLWNGAAQRERVSDVFRLGILRDEDVKIGAMFETILSLSDSQDEVTGEMLAMFGATSPGLVVPRFDADDVAASQNEVGLGRVQARTSPAFLAGRAASWLHDPSPGQKSALDREAITSTYKDLVGSNSVVVAVAGDFDPISIGELVKHRLVPLKRVPDRATQANRAEHPERRFVLVDRKGLEHALFALHFDRPSLAATKSAAFQIACRILRERANARTRLENGYTYGVNIDCRPLKSMEVTMSAESPRARRALDDLLGAIESLSTEPPTDNELTTARVQLGADLTEAFTTNTSASYTLAVLAAFDYHPEILARVADAAEHVQASDVQAIGQQYFAAPRVAVVGDATTIGDAFGGTKLGPPIVQHVR